MDKILELERLLKKAVADALPSRPFGLLLSGGVDSGLLAALSKPDKVFTCHFPYGEKYDEFEYAKKTATHLNLDQVVVEHSKEGFEEKLPKALQVLGKPISHFSLYPLYEVFETAKKHGITTLLSGEGPDEYFGGYARYIIFKKYWELRDQCAELPELANYKSMVDKSMGTKGQLYKKMIDYPVSAEELDASWDTKASDITNLGKIDLRYSGIEDMEQALAKHFGITLLYPYMTPEIEEFAWPLHDELKVHGAITKYIFKRVAENYIPYDVVWRKNKMGGPVFPVNTVMGWLDKGEFDKTKYLEYQRQCLESQSS